MIRHNAKAFIISVSQCKLCSRQKGTQKWTVVHYKSKKVQLYSCRQFTKCWLIFKAAFTLRTRSKSVIQTSLRSHHWLTDFMDYHTATCLVTRFSLTVVCFCHCVEQLLPVSTNNWQVKKIQMRNRGQHQAHNLSNWWQQDIRSWQNTSLHFLVQDSK